MTPPGQPVVYMEAAQPTNLVAAEPVGDVFSKSWRLFSANWKVQVGATAIALLIAVGIELIPVLGQIVGFVLLGPLWTGLTFQSLKLVRGKPASLSDAFAGFGPQFLQLALAGVVYKVLVVLGLFLLIIPGVYIAVAWSLAFLLVIDRGENFWDAMETSRKTVHPRWWWFFLLWIVIVALVLIGAIPLFLGWLVAFPVINNAFAIVYNNTFPNTPTPPPLNNDSQAGADA